jgi:hypothetical protein
MTGRTPDGSYNDLDQPTMGMADTRFGRNVPLEEAYQESPQDLMSPNPRVVSRELLTRKEFVPASSLNILAAAWIQFMVKDWVSHGEGDPQHVYELPTAADDPWPQKPLTILKTLADPTRPAGSPGPETFLNHETHWWDASQVYGGGTKPVDKASRRSGVDGKLLIGDDGKLVFPEDPRFNPELVPGWWLGLEMMGTVRPRAQRHLRRAQAQLPTLDRRRALPASAADQRVADRQDSHGGMDSCHPVAPHNGRRAPCELVGNRWRAGTQNLRPNQQQRVHQRHPGSEDRTLRSALLADRRVHDRLPHASADPR